VSAGLFITGTGTGVGKTFVTCLLINALRATGRRVAAYKPLCCGGREDVVALSQATGGVFSLDEINPVWLRMPASPRAAAMIEGRTIDRLDLQRALTSLTARSETVVVEGAGGWEVPIAPGYRMADLAEEIGFPVVVVVDNRLGALNHTILTVEAIQRRGLKCRGVILNHASDERDAASISHRMILNEELTVPVLAELMHGEESWPTEPGMVLSDWA
jgi:dethiobiotin synthetase